jgi:transcriptional regulator with PAS, ATPase and Fis domain
MTFHESQTQSLEPDPRRRGQVVTLRATSTGAQYTLDPGARRWVIGSGESCDVVVPDPYVSTVHCVLERRLGGVLVVRDRNSRNGTHVDGSPIEGAELRVGSYLSIGATTLVAMAAPTAARTRAVEILRGTNPAFRASIEQAVRAAQSECNVLVVGETGTGKDLFARVIHEGSRRAQHDLVAVNCGAIPRELVGSELFGHDKGAFTGALADRDGYFVEAHRGTLFLDEIGELPIELQPHLLRVLESRRVRRVGGSTERHVDVRIVAATNQLDGLGTESSRLRLDLYHRLATVVLSLPPLRERMSDLPELVEAMLDELVPEHGTKRVADEAWDALLRYSWPGNVRELRHAVARAVALGGETLGTIDFFPEIRRRNPTGTTSAVSRVMPYEGLLRNAMEQALATKGTIRAAAEHLGMPKSTFADRARAWGLYTAPKIRLPKP